MKFPFNISMGNNGFQHRNVWKKFKAEVIGMGPQILNTK
jgi:hypothetical protein